MIAIETLLGPNGWSREFTSPPQMNPLTEDDALQEAQVLDVRFDALRLTVGVLFELRAALQLREANTGVLVARGVQELSWTAGPRATSRTAWTVMSSRPELRDGLFALSLGMWPESRIALRAESAAFFCGDVPGLERIPDYGSEDDPAVRANLASWQSKFAPLHGVFVNPMPAH